jgi:predicted aspartyl protease
MFSIRSMRVLWLALLSTFPCFSALAAAEDIEMRAAKPAAELPFKLLSGNLIVVKGRVGPFDPVNILLDTGTSPTIISKAVAERLGLKGAPGLLLTLNGMVSTQSVVLSHVQIGTLAANSVEAVIEDLGFLKEKVGVPIEAVVGFDLLGANNLTIDYRKKKIVFGASATRKKVPFKAQGSLLTVNATIDGQQVRLLVDSGAGGLLLCRNPSRSNPGQRDRKGDALITTAAGVGRSDWFLASQVSLGGEKLGTRVVIFDDWVKHLETISTVYWDFRLWGSTKCLSILEVGYSVGSSHRGLSPHNRSPLMTATTCHC